MAITAMFMCGLGNQTTMSEREFKKLLEKFDTDKDGKISREELRMGLKKMGKWFCTRKTRHGLRYADENGNGYIDPDEIDNLVAFARKFWHINIVAY